MIKSEAEREILVRALEAYILEKGKSSYQNGKMSHPSCFFQSVMIREGAKNLLKEVKSFPVMAAPGAKLYRCAEDPKQKTWFWEEVPADSPEYDKGALAAAEGKWVSMTYIRGEACNIYRSSRTEWGQLGNITYWAETD